MGGLAEGLEASAIVNDAPLWWGLYRRLLYTATGSGSQLPGATRPNQWPEARFCCVKKMVRREGAEDQWDEVVLF